MWLNSSSVSCWVLFGNVLCCKSHAFVSGGTLLDFFRQKRVFSFKELPGLHTSPPPPATTTLPVYRCCGSVFITVGLNVFVVCNEPQLVPRESTIASVSSHLDHICHQTRLSCTAPPFTPGFACFCVHASTYIAHKNTLVECIDLYSFFFVFLSF